MPDAEPATLQILRVATPPTVSHSATFSATRLDHTILGGDADPFMSIDHFTMGAPTFPPHPHAGFSAVTYVLPESAGSMHNRDSRGDSSVIGPGGLHWTAAGAGIVHEEVPHPAGSVVEGFQIFVKQPVGDEVAPARIYHVDPADIPEAAFGGGGIERVIAGASGAGQAPFVTPSPLVALDVKLAAGDIYRWSTPWPETAVAVYVFKGAAVLNGETVAAPSVVLMRRGSGRVVVESGEEGARLFLMAGEPLDLPIYTNGPFALSSREAIQTAVQRYHAGGMGRL